MKTIFFLLCPLLALAAPEEKSSPINHVEAKVVAQLLKEKDKNKRPVILDIRTPAEFEKGHLEKSQNIDYFSKTFEAEIAKLNKEKHYIVHCHSGARSTKSLKVFERLGFKNIHHLVGGYNAWAKGKFKIVK